MFPFNNGFPSSNSPFDRTFFPSTSSFKPPPPPLTAPFFPTHPLNQMANSSAQVVTSTLNSLYPNVTCTYGQDNAFRNSQSSQNLPYPPIHSPIPSHPSYVSTNTTYLPSEIVIPPIHQIARYLSDAVDTVFRGLDEAEYNMNNMRPLPFNNNSSNWQNNHGTNNLGPNNYIPANNNYMPPPQQNHFQPPPQQFPMPTPAPQAPTFEQNNVSNNQYQHANQQNIYYPTVRPIQPFNPHDDAARLYKAMKGYGTDEKTLIDVLCKRPYSQRKDIILSFQTCYGKDLIKAIDSETSGNFRQLLRALLISPSQLQAQDIKEAIDVWGTDEKTVIDILCTKTNTEMQLLKNTYQQAYGKLLENDVKDDVSGFFKRFLVSLMTANRLEAPADYQKAVYIARELYKAGEGRLGTDEVVFNRIFATESFPQLRMVYEEYQKIKGPIENAIRNEMSSSVEKAFLTLTAYYAQLLYESMKGLGTKDRTLIRTMVLRSEIDMAQIKMEFNRMYRNSLESFIRSDTSGDYKKALLCLAGESV